MTHLISWMPPGLSSLALASVTVEAGGQPRWSCQVPTEAGWRELGQRLRAGRERLLKMPVTEIVDVIDRCAQKWCDRSFGPRRAARDAAVEATGFSAEAVERSFDVELRNYRAPSLLATLRRELGTQAALDGFVPSSELSGATMAIGPGVVLAVLTGNVPALPALPIVRSLLVKSAVVAKVASGEPTFASRFVETLVNEDARLSDALAVTYWGRDDDATVEAALAQADAVIAYGGQEACAAIRARIRPHQKYIEHGHKLSVCLLSAEYVRAVGREEVARRLAVDASMFNQHACIAPQAVVVEGDAAEAKAVGQALAEAMKAYAEACPLGEMDIADQAAQQVFAAGQAWLAVTSDAHELWSSTNFEWTVSVAPVLTPRHWLGHRTMQVVPVANLDGAMDWVIPLGPFLQNVGLGASGERMRSLGERLARAGACRICEPGRMAEPSMMWKHDGMSCVAELVRWCDVEMHTAASDAVRPEGREG